MERDPSDALADLDDEFIKASELCNETRLVLLIDNTYRSKPPPRTAQFYKSLLVSIKGVVAYANQFDNFERLQTMSTTVRDTLYYLFSHADKLSARAKIINKWPNGFDGDEDAVWPSDPVLPTGAPLPLISV